MDTGTFDKLEDAMDHDCYKEDRAEADGGNQEIRGGESVAFEEQYREAAVNCFRYFGFTSFEQVDRLTIAQYEILMEALSLKSVDQDFHEHRQAFLNFAVQAERQVGKGKTKPVYRKFSQFYDYERELQKVRAKSHVFLE